MRISHMVINVLRKPILSGPLESDIGRVRDMSEIATENKGIFLFYKIPHKLLPWLKIKVQIQCKYEDGDTPRTSNGVLKIKLK